MDKMMPSYIVLLSMILFIDFSAQKLVNTSTTFSSCIASEGKSLLKFKKGLIDHPLALSSWKKGFKDCCTWRGIMCDKFTGHVIGLDLGYKILHYDEFLKGKTLEKSIIDRYFTSNWLTVEMFDANSLLELKHLNYLDMSGVDFNSISIPPLIGSLKQLQYLNFSYVNFLGIVPHHLGNLSSLRVLDLSGITDLKVDDFTWVSRLSALQHLDMSYMDLSATEDLVKVLNMLPCLKVLILSACSLDNINLQHTCFVNSSSLSIVQHLDLRGNFFKGEVPCFLQNMTSLRNLDLSKNLYTSSSFQFLRLTNLVNINLAYNSFQHNVDWTSEFLLNNKCHLKSLDLSINHFSGDISTFFQNSSGCWKYNLERILLGDNLFNGHLPKDIDEIKKLIYLDISGNHNLNGSIPESLGRLSALTELHLKSNNLSGSIPSSFGNLKSLRVMNLQRNKLSGLIPSSLGNLSFLSQLDLSGNSQLTGEIPISFAKLSNLELLDTTNTSLNGTLYEAHFANMSKLYDLRISSFRFIVRLGWVPPFQLTYLLMQSCDVGGRFPEWIKMQKGLGQLHLTNCSISGTLPKWIHYMNLTILDLSRNYIKGIIPSNIGYMLPNILELRLNQNKMNGSIPVSLTERNLQILDLSRNHFSGVIPNTICGAFSLVWLHLNNNNFTGKLPSTLRKCSSLMVFDIGENKFSGKLPAWIGNELSQLVSLRIRNNQFYGTIPSQFCQLPVLQILDLANNNFSGTIPHCIGNFLGMIKHEGYYNFEEESLVEVLKGQELEYSKTAEFLVNLDLSNNNLFGEIPIGLTNLSGLIGLNLSNNHLEGKIPGRIGDLKSLESLDISCNYLFGSIPESLSDLSSLSLLNLSYNNFSGQIPAGRQLETLSVDLSIYEGNPQLCGDPLPKKCHDADKAPSMENHVAEEDEGWSIVDKAWLYGFIISGFATGFWGVIGVLIFKISWKHAYISFVDRISTRLLST